jgi:hypothetical protein
MRSKVYGFFFLVVLVFCVSAQTDEGPTLPENPWFPLDSLQSWLERDSGQVNWDSIMSTIVMDTSRQWFTPDSGVFFDTTYTFGDSAMPYDTAGREEMIGRLEEYRDSLMAQDSLSPTDSMIVEMIDDVLDQAEQIESAVIYAPRDAGRTAFTESKNAAAFDLQGRMISARRSFPHATRLKIIRSPNARLVLGFVQKK